MPGSKRLIIDFSNVGQSIDDGFTFSYQKCNCLLDKLVEEEYSRRYDNPIPLSPEQELKKALWQSRLGLTGSFSPDFLSNHILRSRSNELLLTEEMIRGEGTENLHDISVRRNPAYYPLTKNARKLMQDENGAGRTRVELEQELISQISNEFSLNRLQATRALYAVSQSGAGIMFWLQSSACAFFRVVAGQERVSTNQDQTSFKLVKKGHQVFLELEVDVERTEFTDTAANKTTIARFVCSVELVKFGTGEQADLKAKLHECKIISTDQSINDRVLSNLRECDDGVEINRVSVDEVSIIPLPANKLDEQNAAMKYTFFMRQLLKEEDAREQKRFLDGNESLEERFKKAFDYCTRQRGAYRMTSFSRLGTNFSIEKYKQNLAEHGRTADRDASRNNFCIIDNTKKYIADLDGTTLEEKLTSFVDTLPSAFKNRRRAVRAWILDCLLDTTFVNLIGRLSVSSDDKYVVTGVPCHQANFILRYDERFGVMIEVTEAGLKLFPEAPESDIPHPNVLFESRYALSVDPQKRGSLITHKVTTVKSKLPPDGDLDNGLRMALTNDVSTLLKNKKVEKGALVSLHLNESHNHLRYEELLVGDQLRFAVARIAKGLDEQLTLYLKKPLLTTWSDYFEFGEKRGINAARRERAKLLQAMAKTCIDQAKDHTLTEADANAYLQTFCEFAKKHKEDNRLSNWMNYFTDRFTSRFARAVQNAFDGVPELSRKQIKSYTAKKSPRHAFTAEGGVQVARALKLLLQRRSKYAYSATSRIRVGRELIPELDVKLNELANSTPEQLQDNYKVLSDLLIAIGQDKSFRVSEEVLNQYKKCLLDLVDSEPYEYRHQVVIPTAPFSSGNLTKEKALEYGLTNNLLYHAPGFDDFNQYMSEQRDHNRHATDPVKQQKLAAGVDEFIRITEFSGNKDQILSWFANVGLSKAGEGFLNNRLALLNRQVGSEVTRFVTQSNQGKMTWNKAKRAFEYETRTCMQLSCGEGFSQVYMVTLEAVNSLIMEDGQLMAKLETQVSHNIPKELFESNKFIRQMFVPEEDYLRELNEENSALYRESIDGCNGQLWTQAKWLRKPTRFHLDALLEKIEKLDVTSDFEKFEKLVLDFYKTRDNQKSLFDPEKVDAFNEKLYEQLVRARTGLLGQLGNRLYDHSGDAFSDFEEKLRKLSQWSREIGQDKRDEFVGHIDDSVDLYKYLRGLDPEIRNIQVVTSIKSALDRGEYVRKDTILPELRNMVGQYLAEAVKTGAKAEKTEKEGIKLLQLTVVAKAIAEMKVRVAELERANAEVEIAKVIAEAEPELAEAIAVTKAEIAASEAAVNSLAEAVVPSLQNKASEAIRRPSSFVLGAGMFGWLATQSLATGRLSNRSSSPASSDDGQSTYADRPILADDRRQVEFTDSQGDDVARGIKLHS